MAQNKKMKQPAHLNIWTAQPPDDHFWAFYHFCRRLGDYVTVGLMGCGCRNLYMVRKEDRENLDGLRQAHEYIKEHKVASYKHICGNHE